MTQSSRTRALEALDMYRNTEGMTPWVYNILVEALSQPATPEGWKLVPVEPTDQQIIDGAFQFAVSSDRTVKVEEIYKAMLEAAPVLGETE